MSNVAEADETRIDGKRNDMNNAKRKALKRFSSGRGAVGKGAVVGAKGRGGKTIANPVKRTNSATLLPFIKGKSTQVIPA